MGMGLVVLCISAIVEGLLFFNSNLKKNLNYAIDAVSKGISSNFAAASQ